MKNILTGKFWKSCIIVPNILRPTKKYYGRTKFGVIVYEIYLVGLRKFDGKVCMMNVISY